MNFIYNEDVGKYLVRMIVAGLLIFHGLHFLTGESQWGNLARIGIGPVIGWPAGILLEIICPILVMLGIYTRIAAAGMLLFMTFAIGLAHLNDHLWTLAPGQDAYRLEVQFMYFWGSMAIVFLGAGKYGVNIGGRWN